MSDIQDPKFTVADGVTDGDVVAAFETVDEARAAEAAAARVDPKDLQAAVERVRKEMGLSRRALADSIEWTESRVWYLGQESVRLDVERNVEDLGKLQMHMELLKARGWAKPTVKTAARAAKATKAEGFTKAQVDELLADSVKATADLRAKHADQLAALKQTLQVKIDEAKAKKSGTAALVAVLGMVEDMVWES